MSATLVVAARSARLLAEAAAREGHVVIALDVYGDADTRRAARRWTGIGDAAMRLDATRLLPALAEAAREPGVTGWIAGSDFECEPALLARGAAALPLLGTAPEAVARVRDPAAFFTALDAMGLPHPEVAFAPPDDARGWLRKQALATGGWHIRRADDPHPADAARRPYWQREAAGQAMSALFVAAADGVQVVGFNALIVRPLGAHPHVYRGAIGPLRLPVEVDAALRDAITRLAAHFALRGLASLDFLLDGAQWTLLEINPRPSASMALYADRPLMSAHLAACRGDAPVAVEGAGDPGTTRGHEVVFARQAFCLSPAQAAMLAGAGDCHDLPAAGTAFAAGDPVCSIGALGNNADAVAAALAARRQALRDALSTEPA